MTYPPGYFRWPRRWAGLAWGSWLGGRRLLMTVAALLGVGWGGFRFRVGGWIDTGRRFAEALRPLVGEGGEAELSRGRPCRALQALRECVELQETTR